MSWNPFKAVDRAVDRALDKGSNVLHNARNEFKDATRAVRRTASSAVNTARREFNETTQAAKRTTNRAVNIARREVGETSQAVRRTTNNFANTARREWNDTTRAVKRTTNRAVNIARREVGETSQALRRTTNNVANIARREFNETTQAARRTTNRAVNIARREVGETSQAVRRTTNNVANIARREFNETTQAARRTTNRAVNIARREVGETSQAVRRTTNNVANIARREFNETTQAARRTTNRAVNIARREVGETSQALSRTARNVANTARRVNLSDVGHTVLDGAGFIPVVGGVADLANAGWYAAKGDKVNAALSAASAIPFAGDAFAAGKLATKGVIAAKGAEKLAEAGNAVRKTTNVAGVGIKKNNSVGKLTEDLWKGHFDAEVRAGNLEVHIPQTTLKSPTTNKTIQLSGKRRVLDNFVKPSREPGIAVEVKATPRAAQSPNAKAQSSRTQAGIDRGVVAGNKKDGYHKVDAQVTKVGLPILGPGGNTGPHLLDPPLDLPHLL